MTRIRMRHGKDSCDSLYSWSKKGAPWPPSHVDKRHGDANIATIKLVLAMIPRGQVMR
ncbi:MAG: hypothetical protein ACK5OC_07520 [Pirellula sp.]